MSAIHVATKRFFKLFNRFAHSAGLGLAIRRSDRMLWWGLVVLVGLGLLVVLFVVGLGLLVVISG